MTPPHVAIVRRGETAIFAQLAKAMDRVMWDRRLAERRLFMRVPPGGTERRRGERRRPPSEAWVTMGFTIALIE